MAHNVTVHIVLVILVLGTCDSANIIKNKWIWLNITDLRWPEMGGQSLTPNRLQDSGPVVNGKALYEQGENFLTLLKPLSHTDHPTFTDYQRTVGAVSMGVILTQHFLVYKTTASIQIQTEITFSGTESSGETFTLQSYTINPTCHTSNCGAVSDTSLTQSFFTLFNNQTAGYPSAVYLQNFPFSVKNTFMTYPTRPLWFAHTKQAGFAIALTPPCMNGQAKLSNPTSLQPWNIEYYFGGSWTQDPSGMSQPITVPKGESRQISYSLAWWNGTLDDQFVSIWNDKLHLPSNQNREDFNGNMFWMLYTELPTNIHSKDMYKYDWLKQAGTKLVCLLTPEFEDIGHGVSYQGNYSLTPPGFDFIIDQLHARNIKVLIWASTSGVLYDGKGCDRNNGNPDPHVIHDNNWLLRDDHGHLFRYWQCRPSEKGGGYARMNPFSGWADWLVEKVKHDLTHHKLDGFYFDEPTVHCLRLFNATNEKTVVQGYIDILDRLHQTIHVSNNHIMIINDRFPQGTAQIHTDFMSLEGIPSGAEQAGSYLFFTKLFPCAARNGWVVCPDGTVVCYHWPQNVKDSVWINEKHNVQTGGGMWFDWVSGAFHNGSFLPTLEKIGNDPISCAPKAGKQ